MTTRADIYGAKIEAIEANFYDQPERLAGNLMYRRLVAAREQALLHEAFEAEFGRQATGAESRYLYQNYAQPRAAEAIEAGDGETSDGGQSLPRGAVFAGLATAALWMLGRRRR